MMAEPQLFLQEERRAPSPPQSLTVQGLAGRGPGQEWRESPHHILNNRPPDASQGTLSSPLNLGLCGWRPDHLSSGPGALWVGCGGQWASAQGKEPLYQASL